MYKGLLVMLVVFLAVVTSAIDSNDVPDDEPALDKRRYCHDKYTNCEDLRSWCHKLDWVKEDCHQTCSGCGRKPSKPNPKPTPLPKGVSSVSVKVKECLQAHNAYRARHGSPPVQWDSTLAREAEKWALNLAKQKRIFHDKRIFGKIGENVGYTSGWGSNPYGCQEATRRWYSEEKNYSYKHPSTRSTPEYTDFTQIVWKASKRLGVGIAKNDDYVVVVARYNPAGNMGFAENWRKNIKSPRRA